MIAGQHQLAGARIPHGEEEVADQMLDAIRAPALEGRHQQRAVRQPLEPIRFDVQRAGEFFAVVEPEIGDEREPGVPVVQRLGIERVLGGDAHKQMAEACRPVRPGRPAVRSAVRESAHHAFDVTLGYGTAVEPNDAAEFHS